MTSTAAAQFGTIAQVEIIPPFSDGVIVNPRVFEQQLRVDWKVVKGVGLPASCEVRVYNLAQASRDRIGGIVTRIADATAETIEGFGSLKVRAFYQGTVSAPTIFDGVATFARSVHQRHTWVTTINGGDGVLQDSSAIAGKVWSSTVSIAEVIEYLARDVMVANIATPLPPSLATRMLAGGYDASNRYASDILDAFVSIPGVNAEWWWDDGELYFGTVGQPLPGPPIVVSSSGAPGTYRMISKPRRTETNEVEIDLLNLPQLRPKTAVTIRASAMAGTYFARTVAHSGSNKGRNVSRTTARLAQIGVVPWL